MDEQVLKIESDPSLPGHSASLLSNCLNKLVEGTHISCEFVLPSGDTLHFGNEIPDFRVAFHNPRFLNHVLDESSFCEGYLRNEIDLEGDLAQLLDLRLRLPKKTRLLRAIRFWKQIFLNTPARTNRKLIEAHYGRGKELYFTFLDSRFHMYSHCLFPSDTISLDLASENKMRYVFERLQLKPGMRLLDIGAGWGGMLNYAGNRGVRVAALTLAHDSFEFIHDLIKKDKLPCEVYLEDFLVHRPKAPYDAIVNFGVIEHIPQYRPFFLKVWDCLKPGGLFYLDGSATKEKYDKCEFIGRHIWPGIHTFMCLHNLIQELLYHGLDLLDIRNESHDYEMTMRHWAQNLETHKDKIVQGWGEQTFRAFRIYLWGGYHAFLKDELQAYHILARRGTGAGPRPGFLKRFLNFLKETA